MGRANGEGQPQQETEKQRRAREKREDAEESKMDAARKLARQIFATPEREKRRQDTTTGNSDDFYAEAERLRDEKNPANPLTRKVSAITGIARLQDSHKVFFPLEVAAANELSKQAAESRKQGVYPDVDFMGGKAVSAIVDAALEQLPDPELVIVEPTSRAQEQIEAPKPHVQGLEAVA